MRNLLAAALLLMSPALATAGADVWTPLGLYGGVVFSMTADPSAGGPVYAGTIFGLYRSLDDGATWSPQTEGIGSPAVFALAVDPVPPGTVWAGTSDVGVWKSRDGGLHWVAANVGLELDGPINALAYEPVSGTLLAATQNHSVVRSTDGAATWAPAGSGLPGVGVISLAVAPGTRVSYAGTQNGVFRSDDLGLSWKPARSGLPNRSVITALAIDPTDPRVVFAGTAGSGLFRSLDAGATWSPAITGLADQEVSSLAVDPGPPMRVYVSTPSGVALSEDGGTSFLSAAPQLAYVRALATRRAAGGRVFAGSLFNGIFRNQASAPTMFEMANRGLTNIYVGNIRFDASRDSMTVATEQGLFSSADHGVSWNQPGTWSGHQAVFGLLLDPSSPGTWYVGVENTGAFKTETFGATWRDVNAGLVPRDVYALAADARDPETLYAATSFRGVFQTNDAGRSWMSLGLQNVIVFDVAVRPGASGAVLAATSVGLYELRGTSGGADWFRFAGGLPEGAVTAVAVETGNPSVLLAVTGSGLFRSANEGGTWAAIETGGFRVLSLAIDPANQGVVYAGTAGGGLFRSTNRGETFAATGPGGAASATAVAVAPSGTVLAGTRDAVFISRDKGASWALAARTTGVVTRFAIDPNNAARVFASADAGGLLHSADGGATFQSTATPARVLSAVVSRATPSSVLLGTRDQGVLATEDDGETTAPRSAGMSHFVYSFALDPRDPSTLWAGTVFGGVYRSADGGDNWTASGLAGRFVSSLVTSTETPDRILAGTDNGVYASPDRGVTWVKNALDRRFVLALGTQLAAPDRVYVAIAGGLIFSTSDGGDSFLDLSAGFAGVNPLAVTGDPLDAATLYVGTEAGVYRTRNDGGSWLRLPQLSSLPVFALAADPRRRGRIFAGTNGEGLFMSNDRGEHFERIALPRVRGGSGSDQTGCPTPESRPCKASPSVIFGLAFDRQGALYAATDRGLFRSPSGARGWEPLGGGVKRDAAVAIAVDPTARHAVYVASTTGGVFRSRDGGQSWRDLSAGLAGKKIVALHHPAARRQLFAGAEDGTLFRSENNGRRWHSFDARTDGTLPRGFASHPERPTELYLATTGGLHVSRDGGVTWTSRTSGVGEVQVFGLLRDPTRRGRVYAATTNGVFRSDDEGRTWAERSGGLANRLVFSVALHPSQPERLFAGTSGGGVFRSDDGGGSWREMNQGLPFRFVVDVAVDPKDPRTVLAGCEGGGLHTITVAE